MWNLVSCEYCNEFSDSTEVVIFEQLSDYQLLMKEYVSCNYVCGNTPRPLYPRERAHGTHLDHV
jgi:hypothetical protein